MMWYNFSFNFTCTLTSQELRKPIQLRLQTRRQDAFPKLPLLSRWQLPLSNSLFSQPCCSDTKTKLQVHHCAIVLRQLHFFSLRINQQNFVAGFPGDAVTNFLVTFQTSTLRWLVNCPLHFGLLWFHFMWGPNLTFWPLPRARLQGI